MTQTLNGLHSCKPGNDPIAGQVKTFITEQRTSKNGKPWIKIKSAPADQGGQPYRIVSAEKTDFIDNHGNVSYNLEIEPQDASANGGRSDEIRDKGMHGGVGEYRRSNGLDERQRAIVRQHSQSMALELLKLKATLGMLVIEDLSPVKLWKLANYFDEDVLHEAVHPAPPPTHELHRPVGEPSSRMNEEEEIPF